MISILVMTPMDLRPKCNVDETTGHETRYKIPIMHQTSFKKKLQNKEDPFSAIFGLHLFGGTSLPGD